MRKEIQINDDNHSFIQKFQQEKGFKTYSEALNYIVKDYYDNKNQEIFVSELSKNISYELKSYILENLKPVRLAANNTDKNTQIIIEVLNALAYQQNIPPMTTSFYETDVIKNSKTEISNRINHKKQAKDFKKK